MPAAVELANPKELPFNPGKIVEVNSWPRWQTSVGPYELTLDIVGVPGSNSKFGIASFVVMEQEQSFLNYAGSLLAEAIASHTVGENEIILLTADAKGSHFVPWVWKNLAELVGERLQERVIVFRKGEPKVYMTRPMVINNQEVALPKALFKSITSPDIQTLIISPKDGEFLFEAISKAIEPVFVDDFIGQGETIVAVLKIFQDLSLKPPRLVTVLGSDGDLYKETFAREKIYVTLLPQLFPLRLPIFVRESSFAPWQLKM